MIIKVCGLRDPDNIRQVTTLGIDLIGLIFYEKSPRYVASAETATAVKELSRQGVTGVFVNERPATVYARFREYHLTHIQLHGEESPEYLAGLRDILGNGVKIIKAFPVTSETDLKATESYEGLCDFYLFDTRTVGYGGSGKSFDWNQLSGYHGATPFLLSGGLGPDSLADLRSFFHPAWAGIDLNSRFETAPAIKDINLLSDFIRIFNTEHP